LKPLTDEAVSEGGRTSRASLLTVFRSSGEDERNAKRKGEKACRRSRKRNSQNRPVF